MGRDKKTPYWKILTDVSFYIKKLEKKWKNDYNVYVDSIPLYPPNTKEQNVFFPSFYESK
ncbi:MAG: hypothetical protein V3S79_05630 [Candidatus Thermoplasmatota archaeon]